MAIGTNDLIYKYGTQDTVSSSMATVSDGSFSAAMTWTNDDDAPMASFVLAIDDLSAAPAAGKTIGLYCKPMNIQSTNDHQGPNANTPTLYLGSFLIDAVDPEATRDVYGLGPIDLPTFYTSQVLDFYIKNNLGVTLGASAGDWDLLVTPVALGPHA